MEYNLLKKIEKPLTYFQPNEAALRSSYPSQDFVNPGVGNIIRSYDIFVPLHSHDYLHRSRKAGEPDQVGFGTPLPSSEVPFQDPASLQFPTASDPLPSEDKLNADFPDEIKSTNERKRKLMGDDIFHQLMHPKIKTSKFKIEGQATHGSTKKSVPSKHKFKLH